MWSFRAMLGLVLAVVLVILAAFWFTVLQVHVASATQGNVTNLTRSGAIVTGVLTFTNDGLFAVSLEHVRYSATLASTETPLTEGTTPGANLRTDMPTDVPVSFPIAWQPTATLAARMLAGVGGARHDHPA